ncbi:MAG TPA: Uma2 family endonuclease [Ktedonobacteraceae bacterium]|nr:Uma2 family endonuclease [Ktedonobacteraceae bacterium]
MALEHTTTMSVEEYFALEESNPDTRYEYLDGYIYMMSGGSANHATISGNIHAILKSLLRGGSCRVYNSDMKVRVSEKRYFHPDVVVSCDSHDRGNTDLIRSPRVVVEVLSPSTEARDRGRKLQCYLACPSVEEYLLVDFRSMRIEIYRKEQKKWVYDAFGADDEVEFASLGVSFPVADAYEDVLFEKDKSNSIKRGE